MTYELTHLLSGHKVTVTLAEAAEIAQLNEEEIEWAIEEEGRCETDRHLITLAQPAWSGWDA